MDTTSITTNTSGTSCSGTIQVDNGSGNFNGCIEMGGAPSASNSNKTFTLDPSSNLDIDTTYKIRVTKAVKDTNGNAMTIDNTTSTGFDTDRPTAEYGKNGCPNS
jgi:hypothetical protein